MTILGKIKAALSKAAHSDSNDPVKDGNGTVVSTVIGEVHPDGLCVNHKPSASSGSVAKVLSGKSKITKFSKIKTVEKEIQTLITSEGLSKSRQTGVSEHDKNQLARLMEFIDGVETIITDGRPHDGKYEDASGKITLVFGYEQTKADGTKETGTGIADPSSAASAHGTGYGLKKEL